MMWWKVAWRNIWRNRVRSLVQFLVISGAVFIGVVFHNIAMGNYRNMIRQGTRMGSGDIAVYNQKWFQTRRSRFTIREKEIIPLIEGMGDVDRYFRRLYISGYARSPYGGLPLNIIAMEIDKEIEDHPLLKGFRYSAPTDIYIGYEVARKLKLKEGQKLILMGGNRDGELTGMLFRVRGILKTGIEEIDCCSAFADLEYVRKNLGFDGEVHEIAMILRSGNPEELRDYLNSVLKPPIRAYTWREAMKELASAIALDYTGLVLFMLFLYIVISVGTVNVLFMSVMDRTKEFGILRAVGMKPQQISRMILTEGFLLGVSSSLTGLVLALLSNIYLSTHGINIEGYIRIFGQESMSYGGVLIEPIIKSAWEWKGSIGYTLFIVLLSLLASYFPARWINRKDIANLLRE